MVKIDRYLEASIYYLRYFADSYIQDMPLRKENLMYPNSTIGVLSIIIFLKHELHLEYVLLTEKVL